MCVMHGVVCVWCVESVCGVCVCNCGCCRGHMWKQDNSQESSGLSSHLNKSKSLVSFLLTASWPESLQMILLFLHAIL